MLCFESKEYLGIMEVVKQLRGNYQFIVSFQVFLPLPDVIQKFMAADSFSTFSHFVRLSIGAKRTAMDEIGVACLPAYRNFNSDTAHSWSAKTLEKSTTVA